MATSKTEVTTEAQAAQSAAATVKARPKKDESILDKVLALLSSVRFGVTMLMILLLCCVIGMLVMQVEVEGFQKYYEGLTPAQRIIFTRLDFFHIYHSWYFNLLLAITGLNIILASIDRFPTAWQYIVKPKLTASPKFIAAQMFNTTAEIDKAPKPLAELVRSAWRAQGLRPRVSEENGRVTVFGQRNAWNRLGAYAVHVALITIFIGGFLTSRYGVGGMMEIRPGKASDTFLTSEITLDGQQTGQAKLPFVIECRDLQQKLIRPEGTLDLTNTIDWLSYVTIKDGDKKLDALVHLNFPFDYRGYRLFQSSFMPVGNARQVVVSFEPADGSPAPAPVTVMRNGSTDVPGIGRISYVGFYPDFDITDSGPTTLSREYNNPVAQLEITGPDGKPRSAFAFNPQLAERYYAKADAKISKEGGDNPLLVNGAKVLLKDFEKASLTHTLTIQYDPGRTPVYIGFSLLILALCSVFFFSHQRVWAVVEPDGTGSRVHFGGNTNRNRPAFEGRFNSLVHSVIGGRENE